jgi:hypothetical protein
MGAAGLNEKPTVQPVPVWLGGVETTKPIVVVVGGRVPLVPVMVTAGLLPAAVVDNAVTVRIDVPAPVIDAGLKLPEAPGGSPLIPKLMAPLKPGLCTLDTV